MGHGHARAPNVPNAELVADGSQSRVHDVVSVRVAVPEAEEEQLGLAGRPEALVELMPGVDATVATHDDDRHAVPTSNRLDEILDGQLLDDNLEMLLLALQQIA